MRTQLNKRLQRIESVGRPHLERKDIDLSLLTNEQLDQLEVLIKAATPSLHAEMECKCGLR